MQDPYIIIGAAGTIGSAIARRLAGRGISLLLHGRRDSNNLNLLASELQMPKYSGDLGKDDESQKFIHAISKNYQNLSGIIFCAARSFPNKLALRTEWSIFQEQIDSQLRPLHTVLRAFKPALENRPNGSRVIILSTEFVLGVPPQKIAPYVSAKAALTAYGKTIAQELLRSAIRVHILAPGMVKSALTANMPNEYLDMIETQLPEAKFTSAEDIAHVCEFLIQPAGDTLYGTVVPVTRAQRR